MTRYSARYSGPKCDFSSRYSGPKSLLTRTACATETTETLDVRGPDSAWHRRQLVSRAATERQRRRVPTARKPLRTLAFHEKSRRELRRLDRLTRG